eukprot:CAMPEP_0167760610 /NCGR_PEP_ID=MMETSP0110_2-20121227/11680_1 /TAXON_ID=629695 /ORGANISM="Gymnochlora sp., Strain CCMP2014" /LENGTH=203 /DNA_ID=CAMNT_0007647137 /DNA_START=77 /DNA_END=685 /DNA_ORIENTATION=-
MAENRQKKMSWEARSWLDEEGLGFSKEKSRGVISARDWARFRESTEQIMKEYPQWVARSYLPFLNTRTHSDGKMSLCFLGIPLLKFAPVHKTSKGGYKLTVSGGLLADAPVYGSVSIDLMAASPLKDDTKMVDCEVRSRLDNFRARLVGTSPIVKEIYRENTKNGKPISKRKKVPKTLDEARRVYLDKGVQPKPLIRSGLTNW